MKVKPLFILPSHHYVPGTFSIIFWIDNPGLLIMIFNLSASKLGIQVKLRNTFILIQLDLIRVNAGLLKHLLSL